MTNLKVIIAVIVLVALGLTILVLLPENNSRARNHVDRAPRSIEPVPTTAVPYENESPILSD